MVRARNLGRGRAHRIAQDGEERHRRIARPCGDSVHFQEGEAALGGYSGFLGDDHGRAIMMRQGLDLRGQAHRLAIDAVAQAAMAAKGARDHRTGGDADADLQQGQLWAAIAGPCPSGIFVHRAAIAAMPLAASQAWVACGIVQRRIPEGGETVGGQTVDRAAIANTWPISGDSACSIRWVKPVGLSRKVGP